jgi:phosphatidylserine/phosphatidylglycerophosphate/cardiolipin synthase-like enzyme
MVHDITGTVLRLVAFLFAPIRDFAGRFHRRRKALSEDQRARQDRLPPLPEPWTGEDHWYRGGFPPRRHNRLTPLPHGAEYFDDLCATLATARDRVTIAGWCLTPLMSLSRENGRELAATILADVLDQVSRRAEVRVLLWSGAPALFEPDTQAVEHARELLLQRAPRVQCVLDRRARFSHDHHQKAVTIDGRVAYVGGIDLTTFQGDRWDTSEHPLRFGPNWHDVQFRLEGEVVPDVEMNFCQRWNAVTGEQLAPLPASGVDQTWNQPAQIVRTVPEGIYPFAPQGEYGIAHAYLAAIKDAKQFIYLENQYLWSPEVVEALKEAMERSHAGPFRIVLVLPADAYTGKYDNDEHVRDLTEADQGRGIFHAYSPYASGPATSRTGYRYLPIYVHAKVGIIDDRWVTVGSANLNRRGLATDTEMNVQALAPDVARDLRLKLWSDHLGMTEAQIAPLDPTDVIDRYWTEVAQRIEETSRTGGIPAPGHVRRYKPGTNLGSRALDIIQDLTLER